MPLSNRAPVDNAGRLLITTDTPTPAWPQLGGMTYKPVTGELAIIDAVPLPTEPWVGGIRFTNLGGMYVIQTLPAPIFYVGGLIVSTDGRLFMSSNPPIGSVGGWPIAGDGGVAGSGLAAQPIFFAPLQTTLVPTTAGNPAFTFARATLAYALDNANILRQAASNEARFQGARRVRNMVAVNSNTLNAVTSLCTRTTGVADPFGGTEAITMTATAGSAQLFGFGGPVVLGNTYRVSCWVRRRTGVGAIVLIMQSAGPETDVTAAVTSSWQRIAGGALVATTTSVDAPRIRLNVSGDAVDLYGIQLEQVDGNPNQAPGEYVSVGVLAAPYHGNGIDGVKYFATTNGNSVAGNVVTEANGVAIPAATMLGYVAENAATNLCVQSQAFDNASWVKQNTTTPTPNTQAAPDGTLTADTFLDDATNSFHRAYQINISTAAAPYTFSVYAKQGTLPWTQLLIFDGVNSRWANFNLVTGAVGNKDASTTAVAQALPNGWYRFSISGVVAATGGTQVFVSGALADVAGASPQYAGTGQTMYLWGAQVEAGADPTSYIPTTTVAVTRNVDALSYQMVSNLDGALATTYTEIYFPTAEAGAQQVPLWLVGLFYPQYYAAGKQLGIYSLAGTPNTANNRALGVVNKGATAWSGVTASMCLNGGAVGSGAFTAYANSGTVAISNAGAGCLRANIRNVKFYNVRLTDVELIALTGA